MQGLGLPGAWPWAFSGLVLKVPSAGDARPGHGSISGAITPRARLAYLSDHVEGL